MWLGQAGRGVWWDPPPCPDGPPGQCNPASLVPVPPAACCPQDTSHSPCCLNSNGSQGESPVTGKMQTSPPFLKGETLGTTDQAASPLCLVRAWSRSSWKLCQALLLSAVPLALECPGGSSAWEEVTTHGSSRFCQGQRNLCNSSMELAWLCPENAACAPDGPGLVQCLCNSPFHGYKCLREGTFPVLLFCGILGAITLSLSLLLWGTQRRKAKTP
uniref:EGF-like domain-containing protein n=1 Tax=Buteo japonicus TaxID=224669 RepID=A0A8C0BJX0_9AVES